MSNVDVAALAYDEKVKLLEKIAAEIINMRIEFASVTGRYMELKANLQVLNAAKSALQSALRAEASQ